MRGLRRQVKKLTEQKEEERETCNAAVQKAMAESCQKMVNALRAQQCSPNTNPNSNSDHKKKYGRVNFFASPQNDNVAGNPASYNHGNPMQPVGSHNGAGSPASYNHGNPMQPVGSHNGAGSPTSYNNGAIFAEPAVKATEPWYPPLLIPLFRFFNAELSRHKYAVSESRFKELQQRGYVRESSLGRLIPEADVTTPAIWESCPQLVKLIYVFQAESDDTILVDAAESDKLKKLDYVEMGVLGYCVLAPSKNETVCGANQPITRMYSDTFGYFYRNSFCPLTYPFNCALYFSLDMFLIDSHQ
ncbi:unnamed protein product [Anisakis simplex]|uniref:Transcriptional regulator n=1 Tax=Anisakis simplex TaxID=6269 RepID=A0A0M3JZD2_ANISI|nr:unnamed protein product [Anisakis simplex]